MCRLAQPRAGWHEACAGWHNRVLAGTKLVLAGITACWLARGLCWLAQPRAGWHEACAGWHNRVLAGTCEVHAGRGRVDACGPQVPLSIEFSAHQASFQACFAGTPQL